MRKPEVHKNWNREKNVHAQSLLHTLHEILKITAKLEGLSVYVLKFQLLN
jgi:hypothetical protein